MDDITVLASAPTEVVGPTLLSNRQLAKWLEGWYAADVAYGDPLTIDIADPKSIRDALTRAEREVATRDSEVREAVEALRYWQTMYSRLRALESGNGSDVASRGESIRNRLLRLVNDSRIPVDAEYALQLLPNAKRKTISWNLWDLERKGQIQKIADGLYANLDFQPSRLLEDGS